MLQIETLTSKIRLDITDNEPSKSLIFGLFMGGRAEPNARLAEPATGNRQPCPALLHAGANREAILAASEGLRPSEKFRKRT